MNQQRSRRFRTANEASEKDKELRDQLIRDGVEPPATEAWPRPPWTYQFFFVIFFVSWLTMCGLQENKEFDSNCITPGTEFMAHLSDRLRYYIHERLTTNPGWKKIKVLVKLCEILDYHHVW